MSFFEFEDAFVWQCDKCPHEAVFPPGNFWGCVAELKSRGWSFWRNDEGEWSHSCSSCRKTAAEILNMTFPPRRKGASG